MSQIRNQITSVGPDETWAIGKSLGMLAQPGDVFLLIGQLGAGKTRLTQGILNGLGSENIARSPTFVMVTEHLNGRLPLYHMDLYRIGSSDDLTELG